MATIVWDGQTLNTGYINVALGPVGVWFPAIAGQSNLATYVNQPNLALWRSSGQKAALDVFGTVEVPIPCQLTQVFLSDWSTRLVASYAQRGGRLIAARITCEGTHHILGVPTLFRYRLYLLHDQLPLLLGAAIVAVVLFVALDAGFSRRISEVIRSVTVPLSPGSAVAPLLLFVIAGGLISLVLIQQARAGGVPTVAFAPPRGPEPSVGVAVGPPAARVTAGIRAGGGAGGGAAIRGARGRNR